MKYHEDGFGSRIPIATHADVKRIVERDFPDSNWPAAWSELKRCAYGHRGQLAALKCANGNLRELASCVDESLRDYRDLLVAAEYPTQNLAQDWQQYEAWFERK